MTSADILTRAKSHGFALVGVCDARPSEHAEVVRRWIADGRHGSMSWLTDDLEVRLDPGKLMSGAKSVICVADRYAGPKPDRITDAWPPRGRVARYARGKDYHVVIRDRLRRFSRELREAHPGHKFRHACDLLPILERELAARAGIGRVGKHTLVIERGGGSYLVLGEVITTLPLEPTRSEATDPCGSCTRCIDACPTNAITPFAVDASKCISYTTIEHRGPVDESMLDGTDDWLFGCDICQEVCPHNAPTRRRQALPLHPSYAVRHADFDLLEVLGWTESDRLTATMRTATRRALLDMFKRNALVCLGNALRKRPDAVLQARIAAIADDASEPELVRAEARRTLRRVATKRSANRSD